MFLTKNVKFPRIAILLLLTCVATAYAQERKITVKSRGMSTGEAIRAIEKQTDYKLSYNMDSYDTTRMLSFPASTLPLRQVLDSMTIGARTKYMIHGRYIALVPANNNVRPQIHRNPDLYVQSSSLQQKPIAEKEGVGVVAELVSGVRKELHSDYYFIDRYINMRGGVPRFGIKVNLLYGLSTFTPNIAAEVMLSKRSTLELSYSSNPWKHKADLNDNKKLLHGIAGLEYRYWLKESYNGHFFGAQGLYSEYNISGYDIPILFEKEYRYEGNAYGCGVLYGYALPISKMWNLEFTVGADVLHMNYDRYSCRTCDTKSELFKRTHIVPNAGINIVFLIK